jgi:hypothetical protein
MSLKIFRVSVPLFEACYWRIRQFAVNLFPERKLRP